MKLLVDIGNTRIKYCIDENNHQFNIESATEINEFIHTLERYSERINSITLASVSNFEIVQQLTSWAIDNRIKLVNVVTTKEAFGISNVYAAPDTLGVDRWLAILGAAHHYPKKNTLVIDSGTATTVDYIDKTGQHQGGWILPGIDLLYSSLISNTQKVFAEKIYRPNTQFGTNTSEGVNNALFAAHIGLITQGINEAESTNGLDHIVITGGNAELIITVWKNSPKYVLEHVPDLIFKGLSLYS